MKKVFLLSVCFLFQYTLQAQDQFVKVQKSSKNSGKTTIVQSDKDKSAMIEKLATDELYFNYSGLSIEVRNKMAKNKKAGFPVSKGISKAYDVVCLGITNDEGFNKLSTELSKMNGFIRCEKVGMNTIKIVVNPAVRSETVKQYCSNTGYSFSFEKECFF